MTNEQPPPFLPLLTQQKRIRFLWILIINFTWFVGLYSSFVIGTLLPLTLRKFTDDTRLIGVITSIGLWMGIVLGPLANYLSDRLWTRLGRRRPFLIVATFGTLLAAILIPFMPALTPLIFLVVISSIMGDVGSTQEPLWLEIVPSPQRGTGIAIRSMGATVASLLFFQIMFAQYDKTYVLSGGFILTGEQACYLSAALMKLGMLILLIFLVREIRPEGVHLRRAREIRLEEVKNFIKRGFGETAWWHYLVLSPLPAPFMQKISERSGLGWVSLFLFPWAFLVRFCRDVFSESRWWWVYLFYIAPVFLSAGGGFSSLMLVDQFGYSKPDIALTGWPLMVLSFLLFTPFMAWFADRLPRLNPLLLLGLILGPAIALLLLWKTWEGLPIKSLPPFAVMMAMAFLTQLAVVSLVLLIFQQTRALAPKVNPRLIAWALNNVAIMTMLVVTYSAIKVFSPGGIPKITLWFILMSVSGGISCLSIIAGPMLYDFMPKDKIGTLTSGFGLLSTALNAVLSTVVGSWIFYFSRWTSNGTLTKDYSSYYTMQITMGLITLALTGIFVFRALKGSLVEYGRLGLKSTDTVGELPNQPAV